MVIIFIVLGLTRKNSNFARDLSIRAFYKNCQCFDGFDIKEYKKLISSLKGYSQG